MRIRILCALAALFLLNACGPSVNPALQRRVVESFNAVATVSYDATAAYVKPIPYAVGQFVVTGTTSGEDRSITRTALVGKEGDAWIMETNSISFTTETMMQMAVRGLEKVQETQNPDDLDIVWIKIKDEDGKIQTIDGVTLSMVKGTYSKALTGLVVKFEAEMNMATVRVPAGTFNGCTKATAKVETFFGDYESDTYLHPKVPLNGMVKSISKDNDAVTELIEFGSNAKSSF
jgi:hypothetical protein